MSRTPAFPLGKVFAQRLNDVTPEELVTACGVRASLKVSEMKNLYNTNFVLGEGPIPSRIMLIGEAPGSDEDRQGRPFCGVSGRRLNALLKSAGITRNTIYITNAVKQRPPENRKPTTEEILQHRVYLLEEIVLVSPKIIVTLGKTALEGVLGREIGALYGYFDRTLKFTRCGATILPTYHPAALLRNSEYLKHMEKTFDKLRKMSTR